MKFLHMADMHFDSPFASLNQRNKNFGEKRRLEQREALRRIIDYIKQNKIEYLFIAGDLYEHEYIRQTTVQYINSLFQEIPETKIYISPGNHDPYIEKSMYKDFNWNKNVYIFSGNVEIVENDEVDVYGFGFNDFYCKNSNIYDIQIKNKDKINILIAHGSLDSGNLTNMEYNPLNKNMLKQLGFDYVALGHIHKPDYSAEKNQRIVYPGSTISLGFDELGKHGVIVGEITKENLILEFLPIDKREFNELFINVTDIISKEELIEKINNLELEENIFYKVILIGKRNFEINEFNLFEFLTNKNIIKIKNQTEINIDINKLSEKNNLKGIFLKEVLEDEKNKKIEKDVAEKIIEMGLNILK